MAGQHLFGEVVFTPGVSVVGVPLDLGAGLRGVDMGPSALRRAGLAERIGALGRHVEDAGNLVCPVAESLDGYGDPSARYLDEVVPVLEELATRVRGFRDRGRFPLVLGGDHSIALGSVSGMAGGGRTGQLGLLWVDAHADANTPETSPSGNLHGMPLAALLGWGPDALTRIGGFEPGAARIAPDHVALIGVRSVERGEVELLNELGVRIYTMEEVDLRGMAAVAREAVERVTDGTDGFHLSFDVDALDPAAAPGTGTPEPAGLTVREAHTLMERAAASGALRSLEIAEVNPIRDLRNQTAELAAALVASALGKRILGFPASRV